MSGALKVIDLYSGVGGLSLGAVKAGFNLIGAVEYEKRIVDSHAKNFPKTNHIHSDVSKLTGDILVKATKLRNSELAGLIGGPPCQGFSVIGKQTATDERNNLFVDFFRLVSQLKPAFFLAENVPGILNEQYTSIRKKAIGLVSKHYQVLQPFKVAANEFGAATIRTRIFFIGVRNDIKGASMLPEAIESLKSNNSTNVGEALAGLPLKISEDWLG